MPVSFPTPPRRLRLPGLMLAVATLSGCYTTGYGYDQGFYEPGFRSGATEVIVVERPVYVDRTGVRFFPTSDG
ncbi:MAG: hypothetical protein AAGI70_13760, partial [Pseudomonadota bacterium]